VNKQDYYYFQLTHCSL